jgi:PAS domain S-box-containing protein
MKVNLDFNTLKTAGVLDALPEGTYITDRERQIIYWNSAAERITGWQSEDVVGRNCKDNILAHVDKDGHLLCGHEYCPLHRSMVTGCTSRTPMLLFAKSKNGARIPVEAMVAPLRDNQGQVIGGIEVFRDVSTSIDDLNRAQTIQNLSVTSQLPPDSRLHISTRYVPHDLVGGDFLHVDRIDDDHYAVLVADVMGHGVAAALYTMQLRSLWEEYRQILGSPSDFLSALNRCLHVLVKGDDHFATAIHLVANAATGDIKYALAGHEHPLFAPPSGMEKSNQSLHGPCLGLLPKADFPCNETHIGHGESIMLFTDGAIEVNGSGGTELGREGLANILAGCHRTADSDVLMQIEEKLVRFNRNIRLNDDLTLVLLTRL